MSKQKRVYICSSCGHREAKWLGQCPSCNEWNTMEEQKRHPAGKTPIGAELLQPAPRLSEIAGNTTDRITSAIGEFDRSLGGGFMPGSTVLVGGEPGIGKSTLLLQAVAAMRTVLYVSGEEAAAQIRARADRLSVPGDNVTLLCTTDFDDVMARLRSESPEVVVIDSIQTLVAAEAGTVPGTPNQIKYVCHEIGEWIRAAGAVGILVAHVTKEGQIAGPKVVEHMVDAVLLFEHAAGELRFLRAAKNRFGAIEEVGIFTMGETGLREVRDPSGIFLTAAGQERPAGVVAAPCYEGSRVLVVEIQALTVPAKGSVSRTFSDRVDPRRISRIAAVLEKHLGLQFSDQDVYVNVAGGIRLSDVATDLPLAIALYSARTGIAVPARLLATGELTLAGEIRSVEHLLRRLRAAVDLGFARVAAPYPSGEEGHPALIPHGSIVEAIRTVFGSGEGNGPKGG